MDWIKKNSEKFALLLLSLALLGASVYLFLCARTFLATFDSLKTPVVQSNKLPALDTKSLEAVQASLEKPAAWVSHPGSLFVSQPYYVNNGKLESNPNGERYPPVPNKWIQDNNLDLMDSNVLSEDADGDGFSNLDEFNDKTNPQDKNSHAPYTSKLKLVEFIQVKFRLIFKSRPDDDSFQIDTLDVNQPTQILKMGDQIQGTKFKIVDFKEKKHTDANDIEHDDSELTLQNTETNAKVVLILGQVGNSPDSYAKFRYLWGEVSEFTVKKDGEFSIKPEVDVKYKLIDITEKEAKIQNLKTKDEIAIPSLKQ